MLIGHTEVKTKLSRKIKHLIAHTAHQSSLTLGSLRSKFGKSSCRHSKQVARDVLGVSGDTCLTFARVWVLHLPDGLSKVTWTNGFGVKAIIKGR